VPLKYIEVCAAKRQTDKFIKEYKNMHIKPQQIFKRVKAFIKFWLMLKPNRLELSSFTGFGFYGHFITSPEAVNFYVHILGTLSYLTA